MVVHYHLMFDADMVKRYGYPRTLVLTNTLYAFNLIDRISFKFFKKKNVLI